MTKKVLIMLFASLMMLSLTAGNLFAGDPDGLYEAGEAFTVTFQAYFLVAMLASFTGESVPGVEIDGEIVMFDNLDLLDAGLEQTYGYTTIDGVIDGSDSTEEQVDLYGDFILYGGPVEELDWTITEMDMSSGSFNVTINADGETYYLNSDDMAGMGEM